MKKILISSCLMGEYVRYDGNNNKIISTILTTWDQEGRLVQLCPEVAGGLSVPRPPAEIRFVASQGQRLITIEGEDVTDAFRRGAEAALTLCRQYNIQYALLKEGSPSCGSQKIHDGSFQHRKIAGQGLTTQYLLQQGIQVFNENQIEALLHIIEQPSEISKTY